MARLRLALGFAALVVLVVVGVYWFEHRAPPPQAAEAPAVPPPADAAAPAAPASPAPPAPEPQLSVGLPSIISQLPRDVAPPPPPRPPPVVRPPVRREPPPPPPQQSPGIRY